jgi:azurin
MSYRRPDGSRSRRSSSPNDEGSVFAGGSAGGPPLALLIGGCILLGIVALVVTIGVSLARGPRQPQVAAPQPTLVPTSAPTAATAAATAAPAAASANEAGGSALATGSGEALAIETNPDALAFAVTSLEAPADTVVTLTFNNNTNLGVPHNWVLVDGGDDVAAIINTAAQANAAGQFVPPADTPDGLAWTAMTNAGQQNSVTFTTPAAGTYTFLCTYPGHYLGGMRGDFIVQ